MVISLWLLVSFTILSCEGAILEYAESCKGSWCVFVYEVDMLSCVVVGSALGLYHTASWCCCWFCDSTFYVSTGLCRAEENYCLARVELR